MAIKNTNQKGFADLLAYTHPSIKQLDDLKAAVNWSQIESMMSHLYRSNLGELAWPPVVMFRVLLLQSLYNLSDPKAEEMLARDLMFRRFSGLSLEDNTPDHSTIWRFRQRLTADNLFLSLLAEVNTQLAAKGLILKNGQVSIIDATVIEAHRSRPKTNKSDEQTQDPEAGYATKVNAKGKSETTYGYKAHINVDEDGFINKVSYTPANVHDSQELENLLTGSEAQVYADKAYTSAAHDKLLAQKGVKNCILKKAYRNKPLTQEQKEVNSLFSSVRQGVERVFGTLKLHYGLAKARYTGIKRNYIRFILCSIAYNLKRAVSIMSIS